MVKYNRGVAHFFLLLVVTTVAIGAIGYLAYQNAQLKKQTGKTTDTQKTTEQQVVEPTEFPETADWKTYTNTKYGFSLRYPDYLHEYEYPEPYYSQHKLAPKSLIVSFATDDLELGKDGPIKGTVQGGFMYRIYIEALSTPDFVSNRCGVIGGFNTIKECEQTFINDYPAVNGLYSHQDDEFVFIEKDNQVYELEIDFSPKTNTQIHQNLFDQILSTFKFIDQETIRKINYSETPGWETFDSVTGYSLRIPPAFYNTATGEKYNYYQKGDCSTFFANDAGGVILSQVVPYDGGSRRKLYGEQQPTYTYEYEDVLLQNKKSLLIEIGPTGESGSGSVIIVPVQNYALIISRSNTAKDNDSFVKLLQSIKFTQPLSFDNCKN